MQLKKIITGIVILLIVLISYFAYTKYELLRDRALEEFMKLVFENEDSHEFDSLDNTNVIDEEEIIIDKIKCDTWNSLNEIIGANHARVMNASTIIRGNPKKLYDTIQKDLQITSKVVESYNTRLSFVKDEFPTYLISEQLQLDEILTIVNSINQGIQHLVGDAIGKIDYDQFETDKLSSIRMAKILQQFEMIIQSRDELYLGCACDVAKYLDGVIIDFSESVHFCVNNVSTRFSDYIKETILSLSTSMESVIQTVNRAMKTSKTSIEVLYQLPIKVCIDF